MKHYIVKITFEMDICAPDKRQAEVRAVAAVAKHELDCDGIASKVIEEYEEKMLNIDRIREMTADELAAIIKICPCEEKGIECDNSMDTCRNCRIDWLYEEVNEDE